jgi:hypothetical protein
MYDSLLGISGALYLGVFEQPVSREFWGTLLVLQFIDFKMKRPAYVRAFLLPHAAFLVLLAAAAGTGIVAAYSGISLSARGRSGRCFRSLSLPVPEGGEFCKKRPAVAKEAFVAGTKIVQPCFTIRCPENANLWASSVTEREDLTVQAIPGQSVPFGLAECPLRRPFDEIDEPSLTDIPKKVLFVHEVITGKKISTVFDHRDITAGFFEDTEGVLLAQSCCGSLLEHLDFYLPDILTHPLIEDGAEKSTKGLRGHSRGTYSSIGLRPGLH